MRNILFTASVFTFVICDQALAKAPLSLSDLVPIGEHNFNPAYLEPVTTDQDLYDAGKSFEVVCMLSTNGRLGDCKAKAKHINDKAFVNMVVLSAQDWFFQTRTRKGRNAVGRKVSFVAKVFYK